VLLNRRFRACDVTCRFCVIISFVFVFLCYYTWFFVVTLPVFVFCCCCTWFLFYSSVFVVSCFYSPFLCCCIRGIRVCVLLHCVLCVVKTSVFVFLCYTPFLCC